MTTNLPISVRRTIELLGLVLLAFVINQLQNIIMPLLMAFVSAIALLPLYRFMIRIKLPRVLAILASIIIMFILLLLVILFISIQLGPVFDNMAMIKENISKHISSVGVWFSKKTSISTQQQSEIISQQTAKSLDSAGTVIQNALGSIGTVFGFFVLFPVYTFLILFYKSLLRKFLIMWFKSSNTSKVEDTLKNIESIILSYMGGLSIQFGYMTILLGGILAIFGIKYAFLIAIIFAMLNLIPYIGALFGNIIGVLLTLSFTGSLGAVITVLLVITFVQILDNYILMPWIVGSKIRINALVSLFGVFLGGAIAGVPGMFLSLPIMAVLKIIFDHSDQYKKWGVLLGEDE